MRPPQGVPPERVVVRIDRVVLDRAGGRSRQELAAVLAGVLADAVRGELGGLALPGGTARLSVTAPDATMGGLASAVAKGIARAAGGGTR